MRVIATALRGHRPLAAVIGVTVLAGGAAAAAGVQLAGFTFLAVVVVGFMAAIRLLPPGLTPISTLDRHSAAEVRRQAGEVFGYIAVLILLAIPGSLITRANPHLLFPDRIHSALFSWEHVAGSLLFGVAPALFFVWRFRDGPRELGLAPAGWWPWAGPAIVTFAYTALIWLSSFGSPPKGGATVASLLAVIAIAFTLAAFPEELLFRVLLQSRLEATWGRWNGMAVATFLFALLHVPQNYLLTPLGALSSNPVLAVGATLGVTLIGTTLTGLIWAYMWSRYRNGWLQLAIHGLNDSITFAAALVVVQR